MISRVIMNDLSLAGQFSSIEEFVKEDGALMAMVMLLNKLPKDKIQIFKKQNFWECIVTKKENLHYILCLTGHPIIRKYKSMLFNLLDDPYWDESMTVDTTYTYNQRDITNTCISQACESDKVILSFDHEDYQDTELKVSKGTDSLTVYNLFRAEHVDLYGVLFGWNAPPFGLKNNPLFLKKAGQQFQGAQVYQEFSTGRYLYKDNLHSNHYEVFSKQGVHLGVASLEGELDKEYADSKKKYKPS